MDPRISAWRARKSIRSSLSSCAIIVSDTVRKINPEAHLCHHLESVRGVRFADSIHRCRRRRLHSGFPAGWIYIDRCKRLTKTSAFAVQLLYQSADECERDICIDVAETPSVLLCLVTSTLRCIYAWRSETIVR